MQYKIEINSKHNIRKIEDELTYRVDNLECRKSSVRPFQYSNNMYH